jgi:hypothetical protein
MSPKVSQGDHGVLSNVSIGVVQLLLNFSEQRNEAAPSPDHLASMRSSENLFGDLGSVIRAGCIK